MTSLMKIVWVLSLLMVASVTASGPVINFGKVESEGRQRSATVPLGDGLLASVALVGTDPAQARIGEGEEALNLPLVIRDEASRLAFLQVPEGMDLPDAPERGESVNLAPGAALYLDPADHSSPSRMVSWENKYRETLLPLSLMRVHHPGEVAPLPGTPLFDAEGRLVALCHQKATEFGLGTYALPVEAIARVEKDFRMRGKFVAGWIGIRMDVEDPILSIRVVRSESPAASAGIQKGDILLSVGKRQVHTYADAVNALYYLVVGEESALRVLRGTEIREVTVVPVVAPPLPPPVPE